MLDDRPNEPQPVGDFPRLLDLRRGPLRGAPVERLARGDEVVEGADCFFDRGVRVRAVRVEDVDVVELEPRERGGGAFEEVFAREARVVDVVAGWGEGRVLGAPEDL